MPVFLAFWIVIEAADLNQFAAVLLARNGARENFERAAFIVIEPDGRLALLHWPYHSQFRMARWPAPIPSNAVAVVHTHPVEFRRPSLQDQLEARRIGMPIFVATRVDICVADPDGNVKCGLTKPQSQPGRTTAAAYQRLDCIPEMEP